jgi:gamma-glutamyltranspeptidase / glutathione hydrolase
MIDLLIGRTWPRAATTALVLVVASMLGIAPSPRRLAAADQGATVEARQAMVVSVSPRASDAGLAVLRRGGNAVDAAVAVALSLAVTFPEAGNIGGGGFMMVWPGDGGQPVCIDYRETAPAAAARDTFIGEKDQFSHKTVGVPGTVRGLERAHRKFGKLAWKDLVEPAIALAADGFTIDAVVAGGLNAQLRKKRVNAEFARVFAKPDGAKPHAARPSDDQSDRGGWQPGDKLVQPDLARTLRAIAAGGADAFYRGAIAQQIMAEMRAGGGLIEAADLQNYEAKIRSPIHGTFRGYDIFGPPPPSSGGTCVVEMLNILENFDLKKQGHNSPESMHLMIEAMRRAYCDRARYLGDADFVDVPKHLTSKDYARKLAAGIDLHRATKSEALAPEIAVANEGPSTTHFSIVDSAGMAVANTFTLQDSFGSRTVVRGAGFILNNEMTDFNWRPGHTDRTGAIGTEANTVAPGKRMLSSMSPTLVAKDGKLFLVTGSPGGRTIPNTVLCVLLGVLEFDLDARAAVDAPRLHHPWLPDVVQFEGIGDPRYDSLISRLREMGHDIAKKPRKQGDAHTILIQHGVLHGAADLRRSDKAKAAGY